MGADLWRALPAFAACPLLVAVASLAGAVAFVFFGAYDRANRVLDKPGARGASHRPARAGARIARTMAPPTPSGSGASTSATSGVAVQPPGGAGTLQRARPPDQ